MCLPFITQCTVTCGENSSRRRQVKCRDWLARLLPDEYCRHENKPIEVDKCSYVSVVCAHAHCAGVDESAVDCSRTTTQPNVLLTSTFTPSSSATPPMTTTRASRPRWTTTPATVVSPVAQPPPPLVENVVRWVAAGWQEVGREWATTSCILCSAHPHAYTRRTQCLIVDVTLCVRTQMVLSVNSQHYAAWNDRQAMNIVAICPCATRRRLLPRRHYLCTRWPCGVWATGRRCVYEIERICNQC
jgi:hypothetical protein